MIEQLVEAAIGRGDDAEQVADAARWLFEQQGGVQWQASVDDKRAFFGECVEVARDALRQQSQIRTVLGAGPYEGGSWVKS